ncbi:MAG: hypothetical protein M1282_18130 [Chloroflexi bacterium]|nr:hypothetical protein [Chloroflexota bacterium]
MSGGLKYTMPSKLKNERIKLKFPVSAAGSSMVMKNAVKAIAFRILKHSPISRATSAKKPMIAARTADACAPTMNMKSTSPMTAAANVTRREKYRRKSAPTATMTIVMLYPETATKCVVPERDMASLSSCLKFCFEPKAMPPKSAASSSGSAARYSARIACFTSNIHARSQNPAPRCNVMICFGRYMNALPPTASGGFTVLITCRTSPYW